MNSTHFIDPLTYLSHFTVISSSTYMGPESRIQKVLLRRAVLEADLKGEQQPKKTKTQTTKLRPSITPGTILILLAGRFRGRRVVFLKQLGSGLLLVTGPYKYNGVPLQRVHQRYVIATSTRIDISGLHLNETISDNMFIEQLKQQRKDRKAQQSSFLPENTMKVDHPKASSERIALQKSVDEQVIKAIRKVPMLSTYLKTMFSLKKGQAPHALYF